MNCPYCANAVTEGAAFCGNCGAKLEAAAPAGLPPQPAAEIPQEPLAPPPGPVEGPVPVIEPMAPPPGFTPAYTPPSAPAKKRNTTLIIVIVLVALLLCCCCVILFSLGPIATMITDVSGQLSLPTPRVR